jgi:hypothetical protein
MVNKEKGHKFVDKTYICEGVDVAVPGSLKNFGFIVRRECLCLVSLYFKEYAMCHNEQVLV